MSYLRGSYSLPVRTAASNHTRTNATSAHIHPCPSSLLSSLNHSHHQTAAAQQLTAAPQQSGCLSTAISQLTTSRRQCNAVTYATPTDAAAAPSPPSPTSAAAAAVATAAESAAAPAAGSAAQQLKQWLLGHSKSLPTQLSPRTDADGKLLPGLYADQPVQRGQVLVSIPRSLLLTQQSALASPHCGQLVEEAGLNEWQALILHLLCERQLGLASKWYPYMSNLPDQSSHPLNWSADQLSDWLAGSPMLSVLRQRKAQVQEDTETLIIAGANDLPLAKQAWDQAGLLLVSEGSVGWAAATLLSRGFSLDLTDEEPEEEDPSYSGSWQTQAPDTLALAPWADMLRHDSNAGSESSLQFDPDSNAVILSAHKDYALGDEVFSSYGTQLSKGELFLDYGFVDPACPLDKCMLDAATAVPPRGARNAALLAALAEVQGQASLAFSPLGPDLTALTYVRAALATDAELIKAGWRVKATARDIELACRVMGSLSEPVSPATEMAVLGKLSSCVKEQLAAYPSNAEQDEAKAQELGLSESQRHCLLALASEKRALQGSLEALAGWQTRLAQGVPLDELYDWSIWYGQEEGEEDEEEDTF